MAVVKIKLGKGTTKTWIHKHEVLQSIVLILYREYRILYLSITQKRWHDGLISIIKVYQQKLLTVKEDNKKRAINIQHWPLWRLKYLKIV